MWIMIVLSSYFTAGISGTETRVAPEMIAVEFHTCERCMAAAEFTKKQPKVYHAFCVQK